MLPQNNRSLQNSHYIVVQKVQAVSYIPTVNMASQMKVHPDLVKERNRASFDRERLTNIFDGGAKVTKRRREIGKYISLFAISGGRETLQARSQDF